MPSDIRTSWLITGASRGIGLELTRQLISSPANVVVAACRDPSKASVLESSRREAAGTLHVVQMDVDSPASITASAEAVTLLVGDLGLDYIINNAGIIGERDKAFALDADVLIGTFRTNAVGPALVSQAYLPLLERGRKKIILNISSTYGSVGSDFGDGLLSYSMSKAALNMLTYKQKKVRPDIISVCMCPGWVHTDMGGDGGYEMEPDESVAHILKIVTSLTAADNGRFLRHNGEEIPW
ncbi:NAD-P-binding protein [Pilatotrama ljubarskyi]|nr:NAD-P-binding protein [Pilatotrama ljubarskyi]